MIARLLALFRRRPDPTPEDKRRELAMRIRAVAWAKMNGRR